MEVRRYLQYLSLSPLGAIQALVIGAIVGAFVQIVALALQRFALSPLFCGDTTVYCTNVPSISYVISLVILHFLGLIALVRAGVVRPLLVVLASVVTVWGIQTWLIDTSWLMAALYSALIVGLAYVYYTWINRMSQFPVALILTVVSVVIVRLLLARI